MMMVAGGCGDDGFLAVMMRAGRRHGDGRTAGRAGLAWMERTDGQTAPERERDSQIPDREMGARMIGRQSSDSTERDGDRQSVQ